ncbi:hypothetical protein P7F88_24555 [Vibrio hannami]|uniref:hypothetical protein n=1 Tax=Vibrio hannami TaxID=2717094 RepID=UPI00240FEFC5|nr:hypothetical protein [Vibrio hannami]MDG3089048.1 hypothetical protein [Vibrio hannami]
MIKPKVIYPLLALLVAVGVVSLSKVDKAPLTEPKPAQPPFPISNDYDGLWLGERHDVSGDSICLDTAITGKISKGEVELKLVYNNTNLTGWVSEKGEVVLYSDSQRWGYRFSGQIINQRMAGDWKVTNAACHGTWHVDKVSGK